MLLSACQPTVTPESTLMREARTDASAAMQLAKQRLASNEHQAALIWLQQAALLGDSAALQHALQLQQRQQGRLATAIWLEQQLDLGTIEASQLNTIQRTELGLWPEPTVVHVAAYHHPQGCKLTLQPVVSQQAGVVRWQQLLQQWQADAQLSQLPVCFSALVQINSTDLACSEQRHTLLQCRYQVLESLVQQGGFSQLLVIAGRGKASYNNGILQLPDNASLALLRHEFMHVLGFIDEYGLNATAADEVCRPGRMHPNLVLEADVKQHQQYWGLTQPLQLTAVETCQAAGRQAFRIIQADNVMRYYELALPQLYVELAQAILQRSEHLMPVQYYYGYLARQRQDWLNWQQFMQLASAMGYSDAHQALKTVGDGTGPSAR
uniref:Putative orphan protein n=1 Tax=Rheinheimera sp. BAL341 TaxID=1708203 RepID=A0A486XLE7_9GAMM